MGEGGAIPVSQEALSEAQARRQAWMASLAKADFALLDSLWQAVTDKPDYRRVRGPETGTVMVQGRAGGAGEAFNLGEMTLCRCVVDCANGHQGYSYVAGRNKRHAEVAAVLDAMLQDAATHAMIERQVIQPLSQARSQARRQRAAQVDQTRVDFFTMVRGEDNK